YAVIVNKKFWEGLPADIRKALDSAMVDATKYANDIAKKKNDEDLAAVKASGKSQILELTPAERAAWKAATVKVHDEMADRIGKDLIQEVYQATGFKK
ncbi:MAG: C4-dicarboxylate ABC transporter, partial [Desulfuromonadales bacterium]|nr:C4-dicarboxylate ABC transporter [Desulfuromonadales bacterium]